MFKKHVIWLIPTLILLIFIPFLDELDLRITRYFYEKGIKENTIFVSHPFLNFIYKYGIVPAQIAGILSALLLGLSYASPFWKRWRSQALILVFTLVIGAGLMVHTVFKDQWGRPRPKQVIEFGGTQEFRPFYRPNFFNQPEPSKSFPCGHCTMGFYFFAFAILCLRFHYQKLFIFFMVFATVLGVLLGITRIAQGGHFFSDVIISAYIMWMTALTLDWVIYERINKTTT